MAIYYEDKAVVPKKQGTEIERLYYEGKKKVDRIYHENGGQVILIRKDVKKVWDKDKISYKPIPPISIPVEIPMYLSDIGAINVRYSKYAPQKQGKIVSYPGNRVFIYESIVLGEKEKDLAWLLLVVSNFVGDTDKQIFKIFNPESEIKEKVSKLKRIKLVDDYLLDTGSVIFNSVSMEFLATTLGLDSENDQNLQTTAFKIREAVVAGDNNNHPDINIDKFLKLVERHIKTLPKKKVTTNTTTVPVTEEETTSTPVDTEVTTVAKNPDDFKIEIPDGGYTAEILQSMEIKDLNNVARFYGVQCPPLIKKVEQIGEILEKQG